MNAIDKFHPLIQKWFRSKFSHPSEAQEQGWEAIRTGEDTLIASPTGSGKTLAAFLVSIDRLISGDGQGEPGIRVVYVSPLKALSHDVEKNLQEPLLEIRELARAEGIVLPEIEIGLRTGDTPSRDRARMLRRPPHILITTPESLYLMLTAERSRKLLETVETLIVDEIHALVPNRRGTHLALSMARLDHVSKFRPSRVGLSATQKPLEASASFLTGTDRPCRLVDIGHSRELELNIWVPRHDLQAVASAEHWNEIYEDLGRVIQEHRTTLIFVNTRRLAERTAHALSTQVEGLEVAAHHGSLSRGTRLRLEQQLKAGELRALVSTSSLELGIDVGTIDLVCQIQSPRHIHALLQRVGRSGHSLERTPRGRLYPLTRDDLVECAALVHALLEGGLDRLSIPENARDVLIQQVVAECACEDWREDDLYSLFKSAYPYRHFERNEFDRLIELASDGITTATGSIIKALHRDRIHGMVRGRRSARMLAIQNGGAIPQIADFRVINEADESVVGSVDEDFAVESMRGDVFVLGSQSWRISGVTSGTVRVFDAKGASPTVPFWLGEAPGRSDELSSAVSDLRQEIVQRLEGDTKPWLMTSCLLDEHGASQIVDYLLAQRDSLGIVPTQTDIVFERFFDESGGMQLVVHAPFGSRINRAWGLTLRKRFCQNFDFELQAAAGDDSLLLSLGPAQSFELKDVKNYVRAQTAKEILKQAVLVSPMFTARWRWVATRSLAVQRQRQGKRIPPQLQRLRSDDLLAAVFPQTVQCQEHISGPIPIPDHPLVQQAMDDCLREAMDLEGLLKIVQGMENGSIRVHVKDTTEPSPFSHEILNGRPYTFLDDAPLEERRSRALLLRRALPKDSKDLGRLDPLAIARVDEEIKPDIRDKEELHDLLVTLGHWPESEAEKYDAWFLELVEEGRAIRAFLGDDDVSYVAIENRSLTSTIFQDATFEPDRSIPSELETASCSREDCVLHVIRGYLDIVGPTRADLLAHKTKISTSDVDIALGALEQEGSILRGSFRTNDSSQSFAQEVCSRRLLARIHRYTLDFLRKEIEAVSPRHFYRFLLKWQHLSEDSKLEGKAGLRQALMQLQGIEAPAKTWEEDILPARLNGYRPSWLDELCLSGEVSWARLSLGRLALKTNGRSFQPSDVIPITIALREDLSWLSQGVRLQSTPLNPECGLSLRILELLSSSGALFLDQIHKKVRGLPNEVQTSLWELVSRGLVHSDGFQPWRSFSKAARRARERAVRLRRPGASHPGLNGRWSLLEMSAQDESGDLLHEQQEVAEAWAEQLLNRWGVVIRELLVRELCRVPWRNILRALRRMEAQGRVRGGRFVSGFGAEQYAWPEAVDRIRAIRRKKEDHEKVFLSGIDPLNLAGILTSGPKVPALRTQGLTLEGGWPKDIVENAAS